MKNETEKNEVKNSSYINNNAAWKYYEQHGYKEHKGMVLHHIDINMKETDPERYAEWRIEDVIPMTKPAHRALHMKLQNKKGTKHTKNHNDRISQSLKDSTIRGKKIMIHRPAQDEVTMTFDSLADAAKFIGCSKQLVSQCLRPNTHNQKAFGYTITIIED